MSIKSCLLDQRYEILIVCGTREHIYYLIHRIIRTYAVNGFTYGTHGFQLFLCKQQILAACGRLGYIDGREYPALGKLSVRKANLFYHACRRNATTFSDDFSGFRDAFYCFR